MQNENNDFFGPLSSLDIPVDPPKEELSISINMDEIDIDSRDEASRVCKELQDMYFDETFMNAHPTLVKRINQEIYALYVLIKMRRSDEVIHDLNIQSITSNPNNASLYRALQQTQSSLLSIQTKIDEKIKDIISLYKDKQMEISFDNPDNDSQPSQSQGDITDSYRGSKNFIEDMQKKNNDELPLFDDETENETIQERED